MRVLRSVESCDNPLAQEVELLRRLRAATVCCRDRLRLTITDRQLFVDGFVCSVRRKRGVEQACREIAPTSIIVNRLRVAAEEKSLVSYTP